MRCPCHAGTQSSAFKSKHFDAWREPFFQRLRSHMQRACAAACCACGRCGAPALAAFSGKRQFAELFGGGAARPKGGGGAGAARQRAQQAAAAAARGSIATAVTPPEAGEGVPEAVGPLPDPQPPPQVLSYQRQRPASIETGRQWVLPEGWPLPPSTEVRQSALLLR